MCNQIKEEGKGGPCSSRGENHTKFQLENLKERDLGIDGRIFKTNVTRYENLGWICVSQVR